MSPPSLASFRSAGDRADISVRDAVLTWFAAYVGGGILSSAVFALSGADSTADLAPGWLTAASLAQWIPMVGAIWYLGNRFGVGTLSADFGLSFRPVDLIGVPLGVITQLVLVRLVYVPLEALWPDTFALDKIEERARTTYESANGGGLLLLILVVVVGAPLVEELIYRGLLQGAFTRRLNDWVGVVVVAAWFAIVHFQPIEIPGLFVVGLVLGVCVVRTRRLGLAVVTHLAFNATGLILVAST
ncbi:MAG: CPBP family intramembrane metalloprotease [Ilumatobacteraceae bacterium]|nr:CPBP family intramembrane metalloprotease [Ilumatobacteraceae bacterium]